MRTKRKPAKATPDPDGEIFEHKHVGWDVRICFAIRWYASQADAEAANRYVRKQGFTYNGGFFHGMACGRDAAFDRERDGVKQYAVTC